MTILKVENLAKKYKNYNIIKDISLVINSGEIVGLLGPNGAGKTTTFYIIVGILSQDKGSLFINDKDISFLPIYTRAKLGIGYLPQEASIFRKLSVFDNIMAIMQIRDKLSFEQQKNIVNQLMEEFCITHLKNNLGFTLSGGERRRVEIARALAANPKFILLDEPFAGIDPISITEIRLIIKHLKSKGLGILITDHNVRETLTVCERAYIVNQGCLISQGSPSYLLRDDQVKNVYLGKDFKL